MCLSTSQTQKEFSYQAQTPTCYFYGILNNIQNNRQNNITVYDSCCKNYVDYFIRPHYPIPTCGINIIKILF